MRFSFQGNNFKFEADEIITTNAHREIVRDGTVITVTPLYEPHRSHIIKLDDIDTKAFKRFAAALSET